MRACSRWFSKSLIFCSVASLCRGLSGVVPKLPSTTAAPPTRTTTPLSVITRRTTTNLSCDDLSATVYFVPNKEEHWAEKVTVTCAAVHQIPELTDQNWPVGSDFCTQLGNVQIRIGSPLLLSPDCVLIPWNVTWTPPQSAWLHTLGQIWPGVTVEPRTYNHRSGHVSTFSWSNVFRLFQRAFTQGKLAVPLACIEAQSQLRFVRTKNHDPTSTMNDDNTSTTSTALTMAVTDADSDWQLCSITEELAYAQDLRRRALQNRKCSEDLRLFLLLGRKPPREMSWEDWEDTVADSLPWSSVPGSGSLDVEPMSEGEESLPALVFLSFASVSIVLFSIALAPELLGTQSLLFGPN